MSDSEAELARILAEGGAPVDPPAHAIPATAAPVFAPTTKPVHVVLSGGDDTQRSALQAWIACGLHEIFAPKKSLAAMIGLGHRMPENAAFSKPLYISPDHPDSPVPPPEFEDDTVALLPTHVVVVNDHLP